MANKKVKNNQKKNNGKSNPKEKRDDVKHLFTKKITSQKSKPLKGSEQKKMVKKVIALYANDMANGLRMEELIEKIESCMKEDKNVDMDVIKGELSSVDDLVEENSNKIKAFFKSFKLVKHMLSNECTVYASHEKQKPYFFSIPKKDDFLIPTLYFIWEFNTFLIGRPLTIPHQVSQFIFGGADLMLPGLNMMLYVQKKYGLTTPFITNRRIQSVNVFQNEKAIFAVGEALISQREAEKADMKGKALEVIHRVDDYLYQFYEDYQSYPKPEGITKKLVLPLEDDDHAEEEEEDDDEEEEENENGVSSLSEEEKVKAMDTRLKSAFFHALASIEDDDIPCECSVIYNRMRKIDDHCDIKMSSYKKLNAFMSYEAKSQNSCKVKTLKKGGPLMLIAISKSHSDYINARKEYKEEVEREAESRLKQEKKAKKKHMIHIVHLYQIPSKLSFMVSNYNKHTYYTSQDIDIILKNYTKPYFKRGKIVNAPADWLVELKQTRRQLSKRLKKSKRVISHQGFDEQSLDKKVGNLISKFDACKDEESLFEAIPMRMAKILFEHSLKKYFRIERGDDQPGTIQKGDAPPIHCHVAKVNNRVQTSVHNLGVYGVPYQHSDFKSWVTSKMGVSAKFDNDGPHPADIVFQGDQSQTIAGLLESEYGVPASCFVVHSKLRRRRRT